MEDYITFDNAVEHLKSKLTSEAKGQIATVLTFNFKDINETFILDANDENGKGWISGTAETHGLNSELQVTITTEDFAKLVFGKLNPMAGMVSGRMKLKGSIKKALKLDTILKG
jgi:putative sterol carrier protein